MILELQRTKTMRDALDRVTESVGKVVHGVQPPCVAGSGCVASFTLYKAGSLRLKLGDAMSIFALKTAEPAGKSPLRIALTVVDSRRRFDLDTANLLPAMAKDPRLIFMSSADCEST